MTHLEVENLASDYLEGLLESNTRSAVENHLADCPACRELLGDVRRVLEYCQVAEDREPAPWLVSKIVAATTGERRPSLIDQLAAWLRPVLQPRVAYSIAMTVFAFSVIINAAGLSLRDLRAGDFNPRTWYYRANRSGHLVYARAEKFYYDLRVVYEIESRFRELRAHPQDQEEESPKPAAPSGGSSEGTPTGHTQLASYKSSWAVAAGVGGDPVVATQQPGATGTGRSLIP
jgi:hypothetical protein